MVPSPPVFVNTEKRKAQPYPVSLHLFHRHYLEKLRQKTLYCLHIFTTVDTLALKMRLVKKCFFDKYLQVSEVLKGTQTVQRAHCALLTLLP